MNAPETDLTFLNSWRQRALTVGVVAMVLLVIGAFFDRAQFFRSYLIAYIFWIGIPLGSLGILMIHHLVGGTWGFIMQRLLESAIRTFPVLGLLFLPILLGLSDLYPWARLDEVLSDPVLRGKSAYLNSGFFIGRSVLYFAIWISVSHFLTRWSDEQDRTADGTLTRRLKTLSAPGLVLYGLTVTFSSIDWLMSLEPHWYSAIYGMLFMVSHALVALAFIIATNFVIWNRKPLPNVTTPPVFQDLGNLLLAFVMVWAYLSFSQFLIIWSENLRHEIPWYLHRITGGWGAIAIALIIFQFAFPFILLLSRANKRRAESLRAIACGVVIMHLVEMFWFVAPAFHPGVLTLSWLDLVAPIGIGGLWISTLLWQMGARSPYPLHDPRFVAIIEEHGGL